MQALGFQFLMSGTYRRKQASLSPTKSYYQANKQLTNDRRKTTPRRRNCPKRKSTNTQLYNSYYVRHAISCLFPACLVQQLYLNFPPRLSVLGSQTISQRQNVSAFHNQSNTIMHMHCDAMRCGADACGFGPFGLHASR